MSFNTSTDSVPIIANYEKYNLDSNIINFYNINKEYLVDIFTILQKEMLELAININELDILFNQIKAHPIIIEKYKIKCETTFNEILINNYEEKNCYIPINCIKEIKIITKNENEINTKYITVFNYQLAMILLSTNKYIYCYKDKENDNFDEISIITNAPTLAYEIKKNKTIYTTDKDVYKIDQLIESINNRNNDLNDPNYFLTGINSYNFNGVKKFDFFYTKIDLRNSLGIGKDGFFIYNREIGFTFNLLNFFHIEQVKIGKHQKYCYFNINIIKYMNSNDFLKLFIIYYLGNLFNNSTLFRKFIDKISNIFVQNIYNLDKLFLIIDKFVEFIKENKINDNFYFVFDNIYNEETFNLLKQKKQKYINEKNITLYFFVQLNRNTVDFLFDNKFIFINNEKINNKYLNNKNKSFYIRELENKFNDIISRHNDIDKFILLLKTKYISLTKSYQSNADIKYILENFSEFFTITCRNIHKNIFIERIDYINDIVKEVFTTIFNSYLCNFIDKNNLGIFDVIINNDVEGILLEKDIIFQIISSLFWKDLKINRIYCYNENKKNENLNFEIENIIIVQKQINAPLYDVGFIIHLNGKTILKIYQIGINKEKSELEKLDKDMIVLDLIYFIEKIEKQYNFKIDELYFGIITSKEGYIKNYGEKKDIEKKYEDNIVLNGENLEKSYKNYKIMKKYCEDNFFEFLIFDKNNRTFSIHNNNDILMAINFLEYKNKNYLINKKEYVYQNISNITKMYYNKNDYSIDEINNTIGKYNEIKILAKFKTINNDFPIIKGKNLYIFWKDEDIMELCCYNEDNIFCALTKGQNISFKGNYFIACIIKDVEKNVKNIVATCYPGLDKKK